MAIDTSIYNNVQAPQMPDPLSTAAKAMSLGQLGMQNQQLQLQLQTQQAMRQAYQNNRNPDGSMNREGMLSDLGRVNPQAAMEMQQHFVAQDKAQADSQLAKAQAAHATLSLTVPVMQDLMANTPSDQRTTVWPNLRKQLIAQGVDQAKLPEQYDEGLFKHALYQGTRTKEYLDNALNQAGIAEKQSATAKNDAEAEKTRSETYKRNPDILGQTNDPAKLVPGYVPKEHQAKALSEIDAAENTKRMAKNIMDSFEQAANENTVMRTGAGILRTPGSVMALHQSLQPTFKDLEGTVRQAAMDNTFRNVTPAPGDTEKTIETKRQALSQYLQSKASAPTARAYGIDLTKFESTSPYQSAKQVASQKGGSGLGLESSAQAGAPKIRPGTAEGGYVFMGGDPGNQKNWKRAK